MRKSLNKSDLDFLSSIGIGESEINSQIEFISSDTNKKTLVLSRPCLINDGVLSSDEVDKMSPVQDIHTSSVSRFIPASGSSTRMFDFDNLSDTFFKNIKEIHTRAS